MEMKAIDIIAITQDEYEFDMPDDVHDILGAWLAKSGSSNFEFIIKSLEFLDRYSIDRSRSDSSSCQPTYGARSNATTFELNCRSNNSYSLYLRTSHLPADLSTSTLPIPSLEGALVHYGCSEVFNAIDKLQQAERYEQKAYGLLSLAKAQDRKEPARVIRAIPRALGTVDVHPNPGTYINQQDNGLIP